MKRIVDNNKRERSSRWLNLFLSACLTYCAAINIVSAQSRNPQPGGAQANQDSQITLDLNNVDIQVLINTVAEVSGKNFIVDPRVKGKVSVISGAPMNPDQLYDVFLSILEVHNFATVEAGSVIKVLPSNVVKQRPTPLGPSAESNDEQITQIVQLEHAGVQELTAIVRPLIPPTSHFAPHIPSNSVVITDTAANIQRILRIIKRIDVPDKRKNIHVVYLEKSTASELAQTLTQIVSSNATPREGGGNAARLSIQALDSIGALVISATDDEFIRIKALIDELDIERATESNINVIALKHARAQDLVSVLSDITGGQQRNAGQSPQRPAIIQADEATNSLVIRASGRDYRTMLEVIEKLDRRRAQVFVETVIAEVSLDQSANLGVTWNIGGSRGGGTGTDGASAGTGNLVNENNQVIGTAQVGTAFELGTGGLNYSLLDFERYQLDVVVNALRADTNSNILSTPTILTLDNEEAEIVVGQEVPFVTGQFNSGFGNQTTQDAAGNVTQTVGNSFQSIERRDVGITLRITPQISEGDTIQLEVMQEISSVSNTAVAGQADLITNRRSIEATVQVDDGQVIVLGGLIQDDVVDTVNRVPVLGHIPLLGALFRSKSKTAVKRNLMVFLKPRIIRSAEQLAKYSQIRYDEVRKDSKVARKRSDKILLKKAQPTVLDEYENVIDDGILQGEDKNKPSSGRSRFRSLRRIFGKQQKFEDSEESVESNQPAPQADDQPIIWDEQTDAPEE